MRRWLAVLLLCLSPIAAPAAEDASSLAAALESITADELTNHVRVLADDTFEGRAGGSRGGRAASIYVVKQMAAAGLQPAGVDRSYYQPFDGNRRNLLGLIAGSDPQLKQQVIVVGAHYDHVGYGTQQNSYGPWGYIHNGADDNASGVAGLLEVAQAMHSLPPPRRTVLFACWDGEEQGLLGSKHWLANPTVPLKNVPLSINLDMIGRLRNSRVEVAGTRSGAGLRRLVSERLLGNPQLGGRLLDGEEKLLVDFTWELKENSDHWPFFERSIPVLLLHTGLHGDYHRPSDDPEKLNPAGMQQVSRLLLQLTLELAGAERLPAFRAAARHENPSGQRALEQPLPALPTRLGITWDDRRQSGSGVAIAGVVAGSPAALAGLQRGDRLVKFDDEPLPDGHRLRTLLALAGPTARVTFERSGAAEPLEVNITLAGQPVRVGIALREDSAEPGLLLLTRVVPGSPAWNAGLRAGDRIYQLEQQSLADSDDFLHRLAALTGAVELQVERNGQLRTAELTLPEIPAEKAEQAAE